MKRISGFLLCFFGCFYVTVLNVHLSGSTMKSTFQRCTLHLAKTAVIAKLLALKTKPKQQKNRKVPAHFYVMTSDQSLVVGDKSFFVDFSRLSFGLNGSAKVS